MGGKPGAGNDEDEPRASEVGRFDRGHQDELVGARGRVPPGRHRVGEEALQRLREAIETPVDRGSDGVWCGETKGSPNAGGSKVWNSIRRSKRAVRCPAGLEGTGAA